MKIGILGGGLGGMSLAYFLQHADRIKNIEILEKENTPGGLCRSFNIKGINYDIGPHVIFSKDQEILDFIRAMLGSNISKIRRSNKIYYKSRFIKYPFENELSALPDDDRYYCLSKFLDNPHKDCSPENLHHFFLKTFGEGITDTYLKPYNEKIWKHDISKMDKQIAGRIPQPPKEDVIKSAAGIPTEGYLHQLFFYYPKEGGINSLINAFVSCFNEKVDIVTKVDITEIKKIDRRWSITTDKDSYGEYDFLISTIPLQYFAEYYRPRVPEEIAKAVRDLKYNSIIIAVLNIKRDNLGDNFAIMIPDKDVIFHRVSKLNALGEAYCPGDGTTNLMVEITYAGENSIAEMSNVEIQKEIIAGLVKLRFIEDGNHVNFMEIKRFEYAYVLCDLQHRKNARMVKEYFDAQGVKLCGRFGEFQYLNMDNVIKRAKDLSKEIEKSI
jgi:protoporphyrinogen oxidase